jgi:hypothetical protein
MEAVPVAGTPAAVALLVAAPAAVVGGGAVSCGAPPHAEATAARASMVRIFPLNIA